LQQASQTTEALSLVGTTVVVDGSGSSLANNQASWTLNSTQPATVNITITNSTGQTVYTGTTTVSSGSQPFTWNGVGNDGTVWPAGNYNLTATGTTASGQTTAITTTVQGKVTAIDLTKSPALLTVNGQTYQLTDIQQIVAPTS
jgi:flagellar basal-body rod modification protein FlgD